MRLIRPDELDRAVQALADGQLVAVPTTRWYMLCADASNPTACSRIFAAKGRPTSKPLAYVQPTNRPVQQTFQMSEQAHLLATAFWPGDLALSLPWRDPQDGQRHAAVGTPHALVTSDPGVLGDMANRSPVPLAATTVSFSGAPAQEDGPAITPGQVQRFVDTAGIAVAYCIDGGVTPLAHHLTIIDCASPRARLIRHGVIHDRAVLSVCPDLDIDDA